MRLKATKSTWTSTKDEHEGEHEDEHMDEHEGEHKEEHMDEHGHEGHDHGPLDPHFWFDPNRVKIAVNEIAARFSALDPEGASYYYRNAAEYASAA